MAVKGGKGHWPNPDGKTTGDLTPTGRPIAIGTGAPRTTGEELRHGTTQAAQLP